ncbi:hypothetical protein OEA41_004590 [Lepraria neglecta]|uniref:Uncharacterized protein n=1 Tax=Lepraria neglecta TaxID=209136 RepID=A0AAE0DG05_9LECA|nr:hypothetical protein OEA41_004590 [Lepraria neglecta]
MLRELPRQAATTQQASAAIAKSLLPSSSSVSMVEHFDVAMFSIKNHQYNQHDKENSLAKSRYQMHISLRSLLVGHVRSQQAVVRREGGQADPGEDEKVG